MGIIKQYDKRSGITYAYESHAYWDPEKKMSRAKRTLLGRIDPETGEIIPTDGRNRRKKEEKPSAQDISQYLIHTLQVQKANCLMIYHH